MQTLLRVSDPAPRVAPAPAPLALRDDFGTWFREHQSAVFRCIRFRVATREAAEDVTSDVFMKALRSFDRYDSSRASPRTWLRVRVRLRLRGVLRLRLLLRRRRRRRLLLRVRQRLPQRTAH